MGLRIVVGLRRSHNSRRRGTSALFPMRASSSMARMRSGSSLLGSRAVNSNRLMSCPFIPLPRSWARPWLDPMRNASVQNPASMRSNFAAILSLSWTGEGGRVSQRHRPIGLASLQNTGVPGRGIQRDGLRVRQFALYDSENRRRAVLARNGNCRGNFEIQMHPSIKVDVCETVGRGCRETATRQVCCTCCKSIGTDGVGAIPVTWIVSKPIYLRVWVIRLVDYAVVLHGRPCHYRRAALPLFPASHFPLNESVHISRIRLSHSKLHTNRLCRAAIHISQVHQPELDQIIAQYHRRRRPRSVRRGIGADGRRTVLERYHAVRVSELIEGR